MTRTCVRCGEQIGDQKYVHHRKKGFNPRERWKSRCRGPADMTPPQRSASRLPMHFRDFASEGATVCGLQGGRTSGKYADGTAEVPWTRIKVDLQQTTCPECLVLVIQRCKKQLHGVLQGRNRKLRDLVTKAHGRQRWHGLKKIANV